MIGSFLTRGLVMVFGYAYPAYECYKTVEMNKPDIEQLLFWCQYWILVAVLTVSERIGFHFQCTVRLSWHSSYTCGTLKQGPYVAKHEKEIDRNLLELSTRAGDMAVLYWQRAASYGKTRIFEILKYVASQNSQAQGARTCQPSGVRSRQSSIKEQAAELEDEEPPSPTSSTTSTQHQKEIAEVVGPSEVAKPTTPSASSTSQKVDTTSESTSQPAQTEAESLQIETVPPPQNEGTNPPSKETLMRESIRFTRGRLRKNRSAPR